METGNKTTNIMIVGVGGQGTLLASRVLGAVAMKSGFDTKVSEIHGMSQRGGSVVTYVKYGETVNSPLIEEGEADYILAFERLEAFRWKGFLRPEGKLVVNDQRIDPMPVITGKESYPDNIIADLQQELGTARVVSLDALEIAGKCGNIKAVNIVLIGVLAKTSSVPKEVWLEAIQETVPAKVLDINVRAFEAGYTYTDINPINP